MKTPLRPQGRLHARAPIPTAIRPPRLWPNLTPAQRHCLAQCLAELIRRQRQARSTLTVEAPHEPC